MTVSNWPKMDLECVSSPSSSPSVKHMYQICTKPMYQICTQPMYQKLAVFCGNIFLEHLGISQLTIRRPLPSVLIEFLWMMRNVLKRMKNKFFRFFKIFFFELMILLTIFKYFHPTQKKIAHFKRCPRFWIGFLYFWVFCAIPSCWDIIDFVLNRLTDFLKQDID